MKEISSLNIVESGGLCCFGLCCFGLGFWLVVFLCCSVCLFVLFCCCLPGGFVCLFVVLVHLD